MSETDTASALDLDALRALEQAATPAPWVQEYKDSDIIHGADGTVAETTYEPANAEFIAAARNALPALLDRMSEYGNELSLVHEDNSRLTHELAAAHEQAKQAQAELVQVEERAWNDGFDSAKDRILEMHKRLQVLEKLCAEVAYDVPLSRDWIGRWRRYKALPLAGGPEATPTAAPNADECAARNAKGYSCTLTPGHDGRHKAEALPKGGGELFIADEWPNTCAAPGPGGVKCGATPGHAMAHWAGGVRTTTWTDEPLPAAAPDPAPHCGLCGSEDCPGRPGEGCTPGPFETYEPVAAGGEDGSGTADGGVSPC